MNNVDNEIAPIKSVNTIYDELINTFTLDQIINLHIKLKDYINDVENF